MEKEFPPHVLGIFFYFVSFGKVDGEKGKEVFYFCLLLIMKKGDGKGRGSVLKAPPFIW